MSGRRAQPALCQRGFSLIELGVALVVIGIVGLLIGRWVVTARAPATVQEIQRQLNEAQTAVEGFVLAQHRLPCPAANTSGAEACITPDARHFPWRTLGVSSEMAGLLYGVNRGGGFDLAALPLALVSPDLNVDFVDVPPTTMPTSDAAVQTAADQVQVQIAAAKTQRTLVNGLDWCRVVRTFAGNTGATGILNAGNLALSFPVAFVVVHPGVNRQFDGNNALGLGGSFRYDLPGREQDAQYDDNVLAVGPADLSARLGCVTRLSAAQAAAQAAFAQYDTTRLVQEYWSLRVADIQTAESGVIDAETGVTMAAMGLALTTTSAAVGLASAANTEGLTTFAVAIQLANIGLATAETVLAAEDLKEAKQYLKDMQTKLIAANAYVAVTYGTLEKALAHSVLLDQKGLNP